MKTKSLIPQEWWDEQYRTYKLQVVKKDDLLRQWLEKVVPPVTPKYSKRCIEIGCYPGRYLAVLGQMGYEVNGIDLTPGVEELMPSWLSQQGCRVGAFIREDFRSYVNIEKYDLVYSIGFIEHYVDWESVLEQHVKYVAPGGFLVVTVPNFQGGAQWLLHRWLDSENLAGHNMDSMHPCRWVKIVEDCGLKVWHAGYTGRFLFWGGKQQRTPLQEAALRFIGRWQKSRVMKLVPEGTSIFAPYCTMVAQRI